MYHEQVKIKLFYKKQSQHLFNLSLRDLSQKLNLSNMISTV